MVEYFVFTVLLFGLSNICFALTKLMRPVVRHRRGRVLRGIVCTDIVGVKGMDIAIAESQQV